MLLSVAKVQDRWIFESDDHGRDISKGIQDLSQAPETRGLMAARSPKGKPVTGFVFGASGLGFSVHGLGFTPAGAHYSTFGRTCTHIVLTLALKLR